MEEDWVDPAALALVDLVTLVAVLVEAVDVDFFAVGILLGVKRTWITEDHRLS